MPPFHLFSIISPPTITIGHTESLKESVEVIVFVPYTSSHPVSEWIQSSPEVSVEPTPKQWYLLALALYNLGRHASDSSHE